MADQGSNKGSLSGKILKWLLILIVILLVILYFVFNFKYSSGDRAGVLMNFSQRGYVFKTYEGELNIGGMGNIPGTAQMNQVWDFSVRDQAIADTLMHLDGHKVSLHYYQVEKNLPWQGETHFFVDGVQVIDK